jgi:predicted DCC family thiol-disulfide oxidoreductase YuxK
MMGDPTTRTSKGMGAARQNGAPLIVLFDGVCNLCHGTVQFIIQRDPAARFRFASLQSEVGARVLRAHGRQPPTGDPESLVLIAGDRLHEGSDAALHIARALGFPWSLAVVGFVFPRPIREGVYRFIARNRYRWFGRQERCWVPTPALRDRFLSP